MSFVPSNPSMPRELHSSLVHPSRGAPVQLVSITVDNAATTDAAYEVMVAPRQCRLISARYVQESNATAASSFVARLLEGANALTEDLDIAALGAGDGATMVVNDRVLEAGDVVTLDFNETGGTVTAPDLVALTLEFLLLE